MAKGPRHRKLACRWRARPDRSAEQKLSQIYQALVPEVAGEPALEAPHSEFTRKGEGVAHETPGRHLR